MKFRLLQWNVWDKEQAAAVLAQLRALDADILCLQELTTTSLANPTIDIPAAIAGLGYHYAYFPTSERAGKDAKRQGVGIFSKFPVAGQRQVAIQQADPSAIPPQYDRGYLEVTLDTPSGLLTVGTTHLSFSVNFAMTPARKREADALLAAIRHHTSRFILAGDLNAEPGSYVIEQLSKHLQNAGPDYSQKNWTTKPFSYHGFEAITLDWRLAHIFSTPDLKPSETKIVQTEASDHLPILSTFEL